jgi:type II secretory pathway pseudopilin PulG
MIVVVIIGILAAIAIPNFMAMQDRAKEGSTKANMHTMQLAAEDYGVQNNGVYGDATSLSASLPGAGATFVNPFDGNTGVGDAWENRTTMDASATPVPGIASYADSSAANTYNIKGWGKSTDVGLILTSGE